MSFSEIICTDVDDFWDLRDPRNPLRKGFSNSEKFVFRGQIDASGWNLVPSAYRKETNPSVLAENESSPTSDMQVYNEWHILKTFVNQCDITGIRVPRDTHTDWYELFEDDKFTE